MKRLLMFLLCALCAGCGSFVGRSVDAATVAAVNARLESRDYTVVFDVMTPSRGRTVTLTHEWFVRIEGNMLHSYLPYVGEAYTPVFAGQQQGLDFDARHTGYSVKEGKRGRKVVDFWATTAEDGYGYTMTVYPGGAVHLTVMPDRKSAVSYEGRLIL